MSIPSFPIGSPPPEGRFLGEVKEQKAKEEAGFYKEVHPGEIAAPLSGGKIQNPSKGEERVALRGLEKDSCFFIRKMEIPENENAIAKFFRKFFWVRIEEEGGKSFYLDIGSLSNRLLFTRSEIKAMAAEGRLTEGLQDRVKILTQMAGLEKFREAAKQGKAKERLSEAGSIFNQIADSPDEILSPQDRQNLMMKFIEASESRKEIFLDSTRGEELLVRMAGRKLLVIPKKSMELLKSDESGDVYRVQDIASGKLFAMKVGPKAFPEVRNVHQFQKRGIGGVQEALPSGKLREGFIPQREGFIPREGMPKAAGLDHFMIDDLPRSETPNLLSWINSNPSKPARQQCVKQIWGQYKQLEKAKMYHGNLQLEHIVVTSDPSGKPLFKFGKWAEAQDLKGDIHPIDRENVGYEISKALNSRFPDVQKRGAVFHDRLAIGECLHAVLTGRQPEYIAINSFERELNIKPLKEAGCSEDMINLLRIMTSRSLPSEETYEAEQREINRLWDNIVKSGELAE